MSAEPVVPLRPTVSMEPVYADLRFREGTAAIVLDAIDRVTVGPQGKHKAPSSSQCTDDAPAFAATPGLPPCGSSAPPAECRPAGQEVPQ